MYTNWSIKTFNLRLEKDNLQKQKSYFQNLTFIPEADIFSDFG